MGFAREVERSQRQDVGSRHEERLDEGGRRGLSPDGTSRDPH